MGQEAEAVGAPSEDRSVEALKTLLDYGGYDGAHHKMWVIDQAVRILAGDRYQEVIREYCDGEDGPATYSWDVGIAL